MMQYLFLPIRNCFEKLVFIKNTKGEGGPTSSEPFIPPANLYGGTFEEFINVDDEALVTSKLTDSEIFQNTLGKIMTPLESFQL